MDLNETILYAQLVNEAYLPAPGDLTNRKGQTVHVGLGAAATQFDIITTIYANDLATSANPNRAKDIVSIGLILQAQETGEAVIAFRGTEGIKEWVTDATFGTKPCPFLASAGQTEDGFTDMYESVTINPGARPKLVEGLPGLAWKQPIQTVTICGHSLGGALATLATLDIAVNAPAPFHNVASYTYASPRTGDGQFAAKYDQIVSDTFRVANDLDLVPRLPPSPPYLHVMGEFTLRPFQSFPPKLLVAPNPLCEHILTSYLFLLSTDAGGRVLPLKAGCAPQLSFSSAMAAVETKWRDLDGLKQDFSKATRLV